MSQYGFLKVGDFFAAMIPIDPAVGTVALFLMIFIASLIIVLSYAQNITARAYMFILNESPSKSAESIPAFVYKIPFYGAALRRALVIEDERLLKRCSSPVIRLIMGAKFYPALESVYWLRSRLLLTPNPPRP